MKSECSIRTPESYDKCIDEMEANPEQRSVLSRECGINFNSILNQLKYFHVCSGALLPDIFHDLLEVYSHLKSSYFYIT